MAEFISALAAGNNAQLMMEVCGSTAGATTVALVAAAHQTGGRVVCILPGPKDLEASKSELACYSDRIEFVVGDPLTLLTNVYKGVDFVAVDCNIDGHKEIYKETLKDGSHNEGGALVVGYNAHWTVSTWNGLGGHFLPIGGGLLVSKVPKNHGGISGPNGKRSKWIVKVDKCTGEEHVFRVTCPQQKVIQA